MQSKVGTVSRTGGLVAMSDDRQAEIDATYELMGLGSADARAHYANWFTQERPRVQFEVTISTTSNPLS